MTIEDFRKRDPAWNRRYSMPFEERVEGSAEVSWGAELDRCVIISPNGGVFIGHSRLEQCVIVEPCTIGDGVIAVAAILQGIIQDGARIEAHADVRGSVGEGASIGRGADIGLDAIIGYEAPIGDMTIVGDGAEVGSECVIGAQSTIGAHSYVPGGARLPSRSVVRQGAEVADAAESRQRHEGIGDEPRVAFGLVDELGDYEEGEASLAEDDEQEDFREERVPVSARLREQYTPSPIVGWSGAKPGDFAVGKPTLILEDFRPGTARSWALSKLARVANLKSKDGRLTKKLVSDHRPDLLEHPVTKEVLRISPPVTDEALADMSFEALSPARYDVFGGITYHSFEGGQMLGPQTEDVLVLAVPRAVIDDALQETMRQVTVKPWQTDLDEAREYVANDMENAFFKQDGHPDERVKHAIGWVRMAVSPPSGVVIVEIQSDRPWMEFQPGSEPTAAQELLREMYFPTFASDALNVVVEWAFANRYREVLVPDFVSRKRIGGTPPKSFYDDLPKKYTVSPLEPLEDFPFKAYDKSLKVRRIIPNRRRRD